MTSPITSVLVVDDNDDMTFTLKVLIDGEPGMRCCGHLDSADQLLQAITKHRPDIVLLDLTMPGRPPLEALAEAAAAFTATRIIVLSGQDDPELIDRALNHGAWGYICKSGDPLAILNAIRTVAAGEVYLDTSR